MLDSKEIPLGDLCDPARGITYGIVKVGDFTPGGVPVIRGGDIRDNRIVFNEDKRVSQEVSEQFKRTILTGGELVMNLIAEPGHCALVPDSMAGFNVSRDVAVIALDDSVNHSFVNWFIKSPAAMEWITARLSGSVTLKINLGILRQLPIPAIPRGKQDAIASLLNVLDNKIAVNDRIATAVDQYCAVLFESIVVRNCMGADQLGRVAAVNTKTVKPADGGSLRYVDISCVGDGRFNWPKLTAWDAAPGRARRGLSRGDTLWSTVRPNRRSRTLILDDDPLLVASTGFAVITPRLVGPAFLYECARREDFVNYLESVAEGSAYPAVRAERFLAAPIPAVADEHRHRFERIAFTARLRAHSAARENRVLEALRDTLLPELMAGRLRVKDAEKVVEEAV